MFFIPLTSFHLSFRQNGPENGVIYQGFLPYCCCSRPLFSGTESVYEKLINLSFKRPQLIEPDWVYVYDEEVQAEGYQDEYDELARYVIRYC